MARKRVIICSNFYPPDFLGGAELIAHQYARCLQRAGHAVWVFAGDGKTPGRRYSLWRHRYEGIEIQRVRLNHEDFKPEFVNFSHREVERQFRRLVEDHAPDVVHFHNLVGLSVGLVQVCRALGTATVLTLHDHWGFCLRNTLLRASGDLCEDYAGCAECLAFVGDGAGRRIPVQLRKDFLRVELGAIDLLVSPSRYLAERYVAAGFPAAKLRVIPYGVDIPRFSAIRRTPSPRMRFSFIGYFGRHKGVPTLLEALQILRHRREQFVLNLVGDGELAASARRLVDDNGWGGSVRFWGRVDNARIDDVYRETDVLVLPSVWPENQPLTIGEAMAAAIPVIGSRLGGVPELVEDGRTGFLVEPGDPAALAKATSAFLDDPALGPSLGRHAAERMAANTVEKRVEEYLTAVDDARRAPVADDEDLPVIVCLGARFRRECASALELLLRMRAARPPRVVMSEWVDESLLSRAMVLWVVDGDADPAAVLGVARRGLPLLVPARSEGLKDLCVRANCGLYYADAEEAAVALELLLRDEGARRLLGANSAKHLAPVHL
jgi:glycosyltransferase involved in cell wall biosynthesis